MGWNPSIAGAAGAIISNGVDLGVWAKALVDGDLLSPATRAQRQQFVPESPDNPEIADELGLYRNHGWTGHDGGIPGYQSLTLYLPEAQTALVILLNTDVPVIVNNGAATQTASNLLATAITSLLTPDHVYTVAAIPRPSSASTANLTPHQLTLSLRRTASRTGQPTWDRPTPGSPAGSMAVIGGCRRRERRRSGTPPSRRVHGSPISAVMPQAGFPRSCQ